MPTIWKGHDESVKMLTLSILLVCLKMLLTQRDSHPFDLIPAERGFYVDYDDNVYSAFTLTNMVLVYFTKAGPFFVVSLSTLSTEQPEDKLTDTFTFPVNTVNKTLVQTCLRRILFAYAAQPVFVSFLLP